MKILHIKQLVLIVFIFLVSKHSAQKLTQFSSDTVKFMSDLNSYFIENSANKELAQDYIRNFEKLWKENFIAGYYKEITINTANIMLSKRMKPYPYFQGYFNTVINCIKSEHSFDNFENWQLCVDKMLESKSKRGIIEFLNMSENLFLDNTFYKTPSYRYYTREPNFVCEFDSIPLLRFKEITLIGANPRGDSMAVEETQGVYLPTTGRFIGNGGTVSWEKAGLDASVNAQLRRYVIDCKSGTYSSDSVLFTGKQFFDKPQLGKLTDRIITENNDDSYPRFDSYSRRLLVRNIYPEVDYEGGFSMRGAKFVGSGSGSNPARIIFRLEDKKFLEVTARAFGMSEEKIVANPGTIKFFLGKDTIYHPGLSFNYQIEKRLVTILRGDDGLQKTPFLNSFHRMDMYFEQILWDIDEPTMAFNFLPNNFQGEAYFESSNFYSRGKAEAVKSGEKISPITKMIDYYNSNNKEPSFSVRDFAIYLKYMANDLRPIIFKMAIYGLIYFNPETDIITVRQRLFNYAENAKHKLDYDIITLHSVNPGKDNANMNLLNFDLTVHGVKSVLLSDTQKVFMFPRHGEIVLKKNRDMEFSGTLASGKFEFIGKDFMFDYEQFKVKMKTIDSIKIFVEAFELDVNGNVTFRKVQTLIENVNGELRIDAPKNKSGMG